MIGEIFPDIHLKMHSKLVKIKNMYVLLFVKQMTEKATEREGERGRAERERERHLRLQVFKTVRK